MSISFDNAATYYDQTRGFPAGVEVRAAEAITRAAGFTGSERVLEVGVGTGRIALPVAPHVKRYIGIDISPLMMRRLLDKRGDEPVSVVQGDATQLPFSNATFDAVTAVHIFHLIPGWQQALSEVARVLKPDTLLIHCFSRNDQAPGIDVAFKAVFNDGGGTRSDAVGARSYSFLEESGWQMVKDEVCAYTRYQTPIETIDMLRRRIWSRTWRLSDEELTNNVTLLEKALSEHYSDLSAPVEFQTEFHASAYLPPKT